MNDAVAYGVTVMPAKVEPGQTYWKAIRVHHLTPEENNGMHNIFIDVVDEKGERVYGARLLAKWQSGEDVIKIDKPLEEPGTNVPIWSHQVFSIEVLDGPSDRVVNLHTEHPDEGEGNTRYHHSFLLVFKRTKAEGASDSVIRGTVVDGKGYTVYLQKEPGEVLQDQCLLGDDEQFHFDSLPPGQFSIRVAGTAIKSDVLVTDGTNVIVVNLYLGEPTEKVIEHYLLLPPRGSLGCQTRLILVQFYQLRCGGCAGFRLDEAKKAKRVTVVADTDTISDAELEVVRQAGCQVQRIAGGSYAVEKALAELSC